MSGFTKLVPEIVVSSIWNESPEVRCVWITMLAIKDQHGNVRGNAKSLARVANVSPEAIQKALALLAAPDADSNSQTMDGRRIVEISGGWHIVNHDAYREKTWREVEAERKRNERENKKNVRICPDLSGQVPDSSVSVSSSGSDSVKGKGQGKGKGKVVDFSDPDFPECLTSLDGFRDAWDGWMESRTAKKKKATRRSREIAIKRLAERPDQAVHALETATLKDWTGFDWAWMEPATQPSAHRETLYERVEREGRALLAERQKEELGV